MKCGSSYLFAEIPNFARFESKIIKKCLLFLRRDFILKGVRMTKK